MNRRPRGHFPAGLADSSNALRAASCKGLEPSGRRSPLTCQKKTPRNPFRIAQADRVTLAVVTDAANATVATLLRDQPVPRYHQYRLTWNGRTGLFAGGPIVHWYLHLA